MAIDKPSLNDFLPNGFETQDKDGYKVNFDADKISAGYDKDTLEILSGPNLNNLLDNVGKNTHILEQFLTFFRDMPIGSFPITNASNQLDYKSVNSFFRNVGELVFSAIPLEDGNLRLLDGSLLEYTMTYSRFITYIAGLRASLPNLFCTEQEFNQSVATYGVCGKFVYDTVTKSLRLPKISGFVKGTLDSGSLGDVDEAKAPNITGKIDASGQGTHAEAFGETPSNTLIEGAFEGIFGIQDATPDAGGGQMLRGFTFDASRSSTVYKNGVTTIEPQAVKEFIYMVVSIDEAEKQVLSAVYNYKGSVPTYADLPTAVAIGEVYNVIGEDPEGYSGANFAWTGEEWDRLGGTVNLSGYLTKTEAQNTYATKASLESNVDYLQGQINTNASNIANIASEEVIQEGIKKIEMLKFASTLGIGKVADTDLYSVIKKYKYSSFDRSKFTVVGSPNITDDGLYSGIDGSNYVHWGKPDLESANKWCAITPEFKLPSVMSGYEEYIIRYYNAGGFIISLIKLSNVYKLRAVVWDSTNTIIFNQATGSQLTEGKTYQAKLEFTGSEYQYYYREKGQPWTLVNSIQTTTKIGNPIGNNYFSFGVYQTNFSFKGVMDLKTPELYLDGVPVFSGNKTGIDTIKPDDYTVVGTPTISADGVASGFSLNNFLSTPTMDFSKPWEIEFVLNTKNYQYHYPVSWGINDQNYLRFRADRIQLSLGELNINPIAWVACEPDKEYFVRVSWNGMTYSMEVYKNGVLYANTHADNTTPLSNSKIIIGKSAMEGDACNGSIDLNAFKIYVDGNLVYQPCLKIPYTESKTGLKITDKLDRAIDMAEQCGFSQYYGLDEQNGLCLVPQGDNITGRRDLISRVENSTTHYVTEIYSDLYCKQMGSGTASTAVTLNIPYKDEYYKLSVPQSAKSKTGFTPTASCDWTAEGYIYLDEVI